MSSRSDQLTPVMDAWYQRAVMASMYLTSLYRSLNDEKQVFNAFQAGSRARECAARLNLMGAVPELMHQFTTRYADEVERENAAWQILVEALAGLCAFFGIADGVGEGPAKGLSGARTATFKGLRRALIGYRTAFPETLLEEGISASIDRAATICAEAAVRDMIEDTEASGRKAVQAEIHRSIVEALKAEVTSTW